MTRKAFQDCFPDHLSYCYGCGRLNKHGLQIKSYWDGDDSICIFNPKPYHISVPGYVYGGLIASVIDCHCACTAAAMQYRAVGRSVGTEPLIVFLTASLHIDYLCPTPLGVPLVIRASVQEIEGRKAIVKATLATDENVCVRGEVVAIQAPGHLIPK